MDANQLMEDIRRMQAELASMPEPEWILVSPSGELWTGTPRQLCLHLAKVELARTLNAPIECEMQIPTNGEGA